MISLMQILNILHLLTLALDPIGMSSFSIGNDMAAAALANELIFQQDQDPVSASAVCSKFYQRGHFKIIPAGFRRLPLSTRAERDRAVT